LNDTYIEQVMTDHFLTLNEFSGIPYITKDAQGRILNVVLPNQPETQTNLKDRFFALHFLGNEPEMAGLGTGAFNEWTGIFQIDIIVPLGSAQNESIAKVNAISKLFSRGKMINDVMCIKCYRATEGAEEIYYRTVMRVEYRAVLPND